MECRSAFFVGDGDLGIREEDDGSLAQRETERVEDAHMECGDDEMIFFCCDVRAVLFLWWKDRSRCVLLTILSEE